MNTYTNAVHPEEKIHQTARKKLVEGKTIMVIVLALITVAAIAIYLANRSVVAENNSAVPYGNALELQYARPWLEAQDKPVVAYSNALELQYARPWLEAQNKPAVVYSNALELKYARPWLEAINAESSKESVVNVYDATGAMLEAINPNKKVTSSPVYDATGAMLNAITPKEANATPLIVYDATDAMLNAINP